MPVSYYAQDCVLIKAVRTVAKDLYDKVTDIGTCLESPLMARNGSSEL